MRRGYLVIGPDEERREADRLEQEAHTAISAGDYRLGVRLLLQAADLTPSAAAARAFLAQADSVYAVLTWSEDPCRSSSS